MKFRTNEYDVSLTVNTTDPLSISNEINKIYLDLYPNASTEKLDVAFCDLTRMYRGEFPGYHPCDTAYHDVQHVLDVTLAMARLVSGYERGRRNGTKPINDAMFRLGVITALFHDMGYVRKHTEDGCKNGAEFTVIHVSRGSRFLKRYLPTIGMAEMADISAALIHFTGFEKTVTNIAVPDPIYRVLGTMLGSADIIAQMSDRCYLEKCRDRLYPEFVAGGITTRRTPDGRKEVVFASGLDLVMKTPGFFESARRRLNEDLNGAHVYAQKHFGGQNLYLEEVNKNIRFAQAIVKEGDSELLLNRLPPNTLK